MRTLVLNIQKGGLGDHLFYSHLPRIAKETGVYDRVLVSERSIFRYPEYKKMVWELNPYMDGFTAEEGIFHTTEKIPEGENLLDRIMLLYGLDDGKRFHEPELYYKPAIDPAFKDHVIYDPNYISYTGDLTNGRLIRNWLEANHIKVTHQMAKLNHRYLPIGDTEIVRTASILDLCSLLVSCKRMYCLTTGTATIAAALGVPVTVFYGTGHKASYRHSKLHTYVHVGTDYGLKEKAKKLAILFLGRFIKLGTR